MVNLSSSIPHYSCTHESGKHACLTLDDELADSHRLPAARVTRLEARSTVETGSGTTLLYKKQFGDGCRNVNRRKLDRPSTSGQRDASLAISSLLQSFEKGLSTSAKNCLCDCGFPAWHKYISMGLYLLQLVYSFTAASSYCGATSRPVCSPQSSDSQPNRCPRLHALVDG